MNVGKITRFKSESEESNVIFTGTLQTLEFSLDFFELMRNPYKSPGSKRPDYIGRIRNSKGDKIEVGLGWHREFVREGSKGEMISLTFDDPSFKHALHVTAFKGEDDNCWPLTWKRERAKVSA